MGKDALHSTESGHLGLRALLPRALFRGGRFAEAARRSRATLDIFSLETLSLASTFFVCAYALGLVAEWMSLEEPTGLVARGVILAALVVLRLALARNLVHEELASPLITGLLGLVFAHGLVDHFILEGQPAGAGGLLLLALAGPLILSTPWLIGFLIVASPTWALVFVWNAASVPPLRGLVALVLAGSFSLVLHQLRIRRLLRTGKAVGEAHGLDTENRLRTLDDDRTRESKQLKDQLRITQIAIDRAPDGISWVNDRGDLLYVNDGICRRLGYERQELLRMNVAALNPALPPAELRGLLERTRRQGSTRMESISMASDGRTFPVDLSVSHLELDGDDYFLAVSRDVSEQKQTLEALRDSEERFSKAFQGSPYAIVIGRLEDRCVIEINERFTRLTGYTREEAIGRSVVDLEIVSDSLRERLSSLAEKERLQEEEVSLRDRWGKEHLCEMSSVGIEIGGKPSQLFFIQDVTERRVEQEKLRQSQKMQAIGQLAGGVAHDFNNLLTVISGYSRLAFEAAEASSKLRRDLEHVLAAAETAADLTGQLLAFSRRQPLEAEVVRLNSLVQETTSMIARVIREDIEIEAIAATEDPWVKVDPAGIQQVLLNLAVNARDAMPNGGKLTIETGMAGSGNQHSAWNEDLEPGDYATLTVADTGRGMEREVRSKIFEPFFTTKEVGDGTGLGLSTAFGIVEQHRGHISVESEPGHGTIFRIHLPAVPAPEDRPAARPTPAVVEGGETILLVEDDAGVLSIARRALANLGYSVLTASNAAEAEDLFQADTERIDLILTDLVMPGMDGGRLIENLRRRRPSLKAVYMSGYSERGAERMGSAQPAGRFLAKPFSLHELGVAVRETLDAPTHDEP